MTAIDELRALGDRAPWRLIMLSEKHGVECLVDAHRYDWARQWRWNFNWSSSAPAKFYARRNILASRTTLYLHRELEIIADPRERAFVDAHHVDHRNGQSLDNREANLRWVTPRDNIANRFGAARPVPSLESIVRRLLDEWREACPDLYGAAASEFGPAEVPF